MYPFEGRFVHEGMAALIAYRLAAHMPISFSFAMNDYGFELLSDTFIPVEEWIHHDLFSTQHLHEDILASVNAAEMARRKFRDIASIAGLVFQGWPGKQLKDRHIQASSQLFFNVFHTHEPDHLLLQQAFEEVLTFQLEEQRLRKALQRICQQKLIIRKTKQPTPFSFPVITDRLRQKLSSEKWEDQLRKMTLKFEHPTHS
jgi:ATP-dependent Lhr-like helicase